MVDENSGRSFNIGDSVKVSVAQIDLARRQMDLVITNAASRAAGKAKGEAGGLTLGGAGGGLDSTGGGGAGGGAAGFGAARGFDYDTKKPGGQRRNSKSKARDRNKTDHKTGQTPMQKKAGGGKKKGKKK
jgi:hypothetical protein